MVSDALGSTRLQIERRRHALTVELGEKPILIEVDPVRLTQLVVNLVDNAAKFTPNGGRISVALSCAEDNVEVVVRDNGVGIPAERAQGIFEPFTQVQEANGTPTGGLGLGLALVKQVAELHGGAVTLASGGPDPGSCFTVRLPMVVCGERQH